MNTACELAGELAGAPEFTSAAQAVPGDAVVVSGGQFSCRVERMPLSRS